MFSWLTCDSFSCSFFSRSPAVGFYPDAQKIAQGAQNISGHFQSHDGFCSINMETNPGSQHMASFPNQLDNNVNEILSPRIKVENVGQQKQKEHAFRSKWGGTGVADMMETAVRDDPRSNMAAEPQFVGKNVCVSCDYSFLFLLNQYCFN